MATLVTVSGSFSNSSGPSSGSLAWQLSAPMFDPTTDTVFSQALIPAPLVDGSFSVGLWANNDPDTQPAGTHYILSGIVDGQPYLNYFTISTANAPSVDLSELSPAIPGPPLYSTVQTIRAADDSIDVGGSATNVVLSVPSGGSYVNPTAVLSAPYVPMPQDLARFNTTAGAISQNLPRAPEDGTPFAAIVVEGTNSLTLVCQGSDVINVAAGATSYELALSGQGVLLQYQESGALWNILSTNLPLPQLDERYDASGSASAAQSNAESFATSAAGTAQSNAEAYAASQASAAQAASLQRASNLSDLASASTARTNLGLGSAATQASSAFDAAGAASTAQSNAESFATSAAGTAQTNAETYAASQASAAQTAAISAAEAASLQRASNLSDLANAGTARANTHIPALAACQAVATSNVTLSSPGAAFNGFTLTNSGTDQVLLTDQTTKSQNGPWVWNGATSALSRPTDYASGASVKGRTVQINNGTGTASTYDQTIWVLDTNATITVDTTATTWSMAGLTYFATQFDALGAATTALEPYPQRAGGTTTTAAKLPSYNVLDYGADPTGVANSTTAFTATMAAAAAASIVSGAAIIDIPVGLYALGGSGGPNSGSAYSPAQSQGKIWLRGAGQGATHFVPYAGGVTMLSIMMPFEASGFTLWGTWGSLASLKSGILATTEYANLQSVTGVQSPAAGASTTIGSPQVTIIDPASVNHAATMTPSGVPVLVLASPTGTGAQAAITVTSPGTAATIPSGSNLNLQYGATTQSVTTSSTVTTSGATTTIPVNSFYPDMNYPAAATVSPVSICTVSFAGCQLGRGTDFCGNATPLQLTGYIMNALIGGAGVTDPATSGTTTTFYLSSSPLSYVPLGAGITTSCQTVVWGSSTTPIGEMYLHDITLRGEVTNLFLKAADNPTPSCVGNGGYNSNTGVALVLPAGVTAGTFGLTFNGATTSAIPWNATAAQVQSALAALITSSGGPLGTTTVNILGIPSNSITVIASNPTSGSTTPTITVANISGGMSITVTPGSSGTFTVAFCGTNVAATISYNATAAAVLAACQQMVACDGGPLNLSNYTNTTPSQPVYIKGVGSSSITMGAANNLSPVAVGVQDGPGTGGAPTSGAFGLTYSGTNGSTISVPYNATRASVNALIGSSGANWLGGGLSVQINSGGTLLGDFTTSFVFANAAGGSLSVSSNTLNNGAIPLITNYLLYNPMRGEIGLESDPVASFYEIDRMILERVHVVDGSRSTGNELMNFTGIKRLYFKDCTADFIGGCCLFNSYAADHVFIESMHLNYTPYTGIGSGYGQALNSSYGYTTGWTFGAAGETQATNVVITDTSGVFQPDFQMNHMYVKLANFTMPRTGIQGGSLTVNSAGTQQDTLCSCVEIANSDLGTGLKIGNCPTGYVLLNNVSLGPSQDSYGGGSVRTGGPGNTGPVSLDGVRFNPSTGPSFLVTSTLTAGSTSGATLQGTGIPVMSSGQSFIVWDGAGHTQTFVTTAATVAGAASVSVSAVTMASNWATGSSFFAYWWALLHEHGNNTIWQVNFSGGSVAVDGSATQLWSGLVADNGVTSGYVTYNPAPIGISVGAESIPYRVTAGTFNVPSAVGAATLGPVFYSKGTGAASSQTAIFAGVYVYLAAGTSIVMEVFHDALGTTPGTTACPLNVSGSSSSTVTIVGGATPALYAPYSSTTLTEGDAITVKLTSPTGSPTGMAASIQFELTDS